jgi:hypothetical protein
MNKIISKTKVVPIAIAVILLFASINYTSWTNKNRYLAHSFDKCNNKLAYVLNDLNRKIFYVDQEMLENKEYLKRTFRDAMDDLDLWQEIMKKMYLLNSKFEVKNPYSLRDYLYMLSEKEKLTEKDLEILDQIISTSSNINPGIREEVKIKFFFFVEPDKKVMESLRKIGQICDKALLK